MHVTFMQEIPTSQDLNDATQLRTVYQHYFLDFLRAFIYRHISISIQLFYEETIVKKNVDPLSVQNVVYQGLTASINSLNSIHKVIVLSWIKKGISSQNQIRNYNKGITTFHHSIVQIVYTYLIRFIIANEYFSSNTTKIQCTSCVCVHLRPWIPY